ncbi:hypothetical protein NE454_11880 [Blautia producta]|uniref:hypothetical protein n=1 Tax=Blautia producta TaxID=33035 RepID=UPI00210C1003|nr:hypothetical protein [Blautia producta]MCQ5125110.1 hypothetical protein [Blautia producta]
MIDFNFAVKPISAHRHIAAEFGLVVTIGFVNDVNHHLIVPHLFGKVSDIPLFSKFVFPSAIYPAKIKIYFWKKEAQLQFLLMTAKTGAAQQAPIYPQ